MRDVSTLQKIPVGQSEWSSIKAEGLLLVNKTALLPDLVKIPKVSLARPHGFGKTMLLSMLEDLFTHGTQNFRNTELRYLWPRRERYPVVRISFSNVPSAQEADQAADDVTAFEQGLISELGRAYQKAGFAPEEIEADQKEANLHDFLAQLSGLSHRKRLVFLIDDWDAPLLAQLDNKPRYDAIQKSLNVFYHWLSTLSLRFLLVTGIMHFQHKGVVDISMQPDFARLLGYTQSDVEASFCAYIELAAQRLKMDVYDFLLTLQCYYQGFCFDQDANVKLYSPLDINRFFAQFHASDQTPSYGNFWLDAQGDSWLMRALIERALSGQLAIESLDQIRTNLVELDRQDLIKPPLFTDNALFPLLTLYGYLTIQEPVLAQRNKRRFVCGCSNDLITVEVLVRFLRAQGVH